MNQQSNEQNNEDLGLLENETETSVEMEQDSNQVTEDSKQSQAQNKIIFSRRSIPKVKTYCIWSIRHPIRVNGQKFKLYQELEKLWENIGIISTSLTLLTIQ